MRLKTVGMAVLAMLVLGVTASTAFAELPDIHVLSGEAFPVTATAENLTVGTSLETALSKLVGVGFKSEITCTQLTSLCAYTATFKGVKEGKNTCKSGSEPAETVVVTGYEVHLVPITLTPLVLGALFLVGSKAAPFEVLCGTVENPDKVKIKIFGSVLGELKATLNADITSFKGLLLGSKGVQSLKNYFNDTPAEVSAELLANFGGGFEKASEDVLAEVTFNTSKMVEILG